MSDSFTNLKISNDLINALAVEKITAPTPIQAKVIPLALDNKDLIVQSETGTGKTLSYLIPLFEKLNTPKNETEVIIMTPTHELVIQIQRQIERLATNSKYPITSTTLIGNVNIKRQIDKLKQKPRIIVGSAGRILELIKAKKLFARGIKTVILDEADRLLDINNRESVMSVIKETAVEKQILLFSASITEDTINKAAALSKTFEIVKLEGEPVIPETITHEYFVTTQQEKIETLRKIIGIIKPVKTLIFLNKNDQIDNLTAKLEYHNLKVGALHGTFRKLDRKKVMDDFRSGKLTILIASDIAARGLQLDGVTHVFNMDIPEAPKEYLHRAGRTGRNGVGGVVISLLTDREVPLLRVVQNKYGFVLTEKDMYNGKIN